MRSFPRVTEQEEEQGACGGDDTHHFLGVSKSSCHSNKGVLPSLCFGFMFLFCS